MDAGEYETNTLLISNVSAISFRIYEPIASQSSAYTFNASHVEDALRSDGHLVYMDAVRRGIWCFYLSSADATISNHPERPSLDARMEVCGYAMAVVGEGNLEPIRLLKNRPLGTNAINTPTSSSSTGSAMDMAMRNNQSFSLPPAPVAVDGKIVSTPVGDVKGYGSVSAQEVHQFFVTAVLSSLTTSFCRAVGAILLNKRSALLPPQAFIAGDSDWSPSPRSSALATFRTYLTTTGSLVISLQVSVLEGLVSSADVLRSSLLHAGPTVIAAPFGAFGALQGVVDTEGQAPDSGYVQSPDTQVSRLRSDHSDRFQQWKTICCKLLQMHGMSPSLLDGCSWLNIHFLQRKPYEQRSDGKRTPLVNSGPTAPWPAVLCFRKPKIDAMMDVSLEKALAGTSADHLDPLNRAKIWCQGVAERDDVVARRKKERDAALAPEHADSDVRSHPQANGYSPMAAWRPPNGPTPAAGAVYPTPPDGVQPSAVTPTFDGGPVLSPSGQPPVNAPADVHPAMHQVVPAPDTFNVGWDGVEPRAEQVVNNFSEEDIFGDLGENMFEGNELTDADFNFFDEQPAAMEVDIPVLPDVGAPSMVMQGNGHRSFDQDARTTPPTARNAVTRPVSPQFTKPELKHARSTLAEESRLQTSMQNSNANSAIGVKRITSPFNPETVFKRIKTSIRPPPPPPPSQRPVPVRRRSVFEKVNFDPAMSLASQKYGEKGPFDYRSSAFKEKESKALRNGGPLTACRISGPPKQQRALKDLPSDIGSIVAKLAAGAVNSPGKQVEPTSDSEDSSWVSEDDDASDPAGRASSPAKSSVVRRRPEDDVISMAASFRELDNISADSPGYGPVELSRLSNSEIPDFSLSKYFADPERVPLRISVSDDDFITVAQILTEQAGSGFLKLAPQRLRSQIQDVRRSLIKAVRYSVRGLQRALPRSLAGATGCQLRPLTEVQDVPLLIQPNSRVQMRPELANKSTIFPIPAPHVELRRYENQVSVLPSAVSFWDTLGLGPVQGSKDIVAVCLFPQTEGMRDNASAFLDRVQSTYECMRLGVFGRLPTAGNIVDGLVLLPTEQDVISPGLNLPRARSAYTDQLVNLAMALAGSSMSGKNFVVYFAYTPENPSSIVDGCAAFVELYEHYKRFMLERKKHFANDLVLQLVPLDSVASETSLVVLSPSECIKLCLETYDRCTLFGGPMPSPAILLEKALPRGIDFKLAPTPSPNLLRENSCIHVAYARSVDERWVTAAWTDNRGGTQSLASYCLGRRDKPLSRTIGEAIHEIWDTTQDLISSCKVHWRVIVTKCGPMDQQEIDLWTNMAQAETRSTLSLVLLTVDTDPSLQLIPPAATIPLSAPSAFYTTPVSTPQPLSVVSPEQSGNNPSTPMATTTPGGDAGPSSQPQPDTDNTDTTLLDTTETTFGVVLSHRLSNSPTLTDVNPALASGYLIKRSGPRVDDAPVAMEVNVVYSDNHPRMVYEGLLREMLTYFRGLGTLARVRGVTERETDVRPWHVAVVEKGVRVLGLLM
ncbi:hypothetical protein VTI74DRAFT_206 [Chaetomium olivicolor]